MTDSAPGASAGTTTRRVLLVDDDAIARSMLSTILSAEEDIEVVAEAGDGDEVVELAARHDPDVVVMDVRMRRMDGIEATAAVTALTHPPRVLILTTFDLDEYVFASLDAGASGFLLKEARPPEIAEGVRVVATGEGMLAARASRELINYYVETRNDPQYQRAREKLAVLSERECDIVRAVAAGKSNAAIGRELYLAEATVKAHVSNAFTKVGVQNRTQLAIFAFAAGLVSV